VTNATRDKWRDLRSRLAPTRYDELAQAVPRGASLLDVGCGSSTPFAAIRDVIGDLTGIEVHHEAVEASRRLGAHDRIIEGDIRKLANQFAPDSFDVVAAIDVLEHLTHEEGAALLDDMAKIARRRVIVFTPNGFVSQTARGGNPWQVHRSGWGVDEFRGRGYRVVGVHGLRALRAEEAELRFRPRRAWALVSDLTAPIARRAPRLAFHLLATRDLS
jgi:Methyltransferase domain